MATLIQLIPNIFYSDIRSGLKLFIDALDFIIVYKSVDTSPPLYIVKRDAVTIHLIENAEFAAKDRPEIRIETDDIASLHKMISDKDLSIFHPNLPNIKAQPWGLQEFALLDAEGTCVIIQQS